MTNIAFLKALRDKLKGGNIRSIHLNILPGRFATRLDLAHLNMIDPKTSHAFLHTLLSKSSFEFLINYDSINLNDITPDDQKKLGMLTKRLNSLHFENEDYYKEHGTKTFAFGYPLLIKRSKKDINKVIKAPLFIWPLEILKSTSKVNTWSILRNKVKNENGKIVDEDIHSVGVNEVLSSFIQTDEDISIPQINEDFLEDAIITKEELIEACYAVLEALNAVTGSTKSTLEQKFKNSIESIPDAKHFETASANNNPWIHFGGVFGLFRAQKESIITDIDRLIERFDEFQFEQLKIDSFAGTSISSVQTDPSQQQILNSLRTEPRKIIQGPPGTGKSQSLTALITNALSNGLKCLVVCEKKTALDVIKNNLHRENDKLGELSAIIEDISKDRDVIVNSVRDRISSIGGHVPPTDVKYEKVKENIENTIQSLNNEHKKLHRKIFKGKSWTELTGEFLQKSRNCDPQLLKNKLSYKDFSFEASGTELENYLQVLKKARRLFEPVQILDHPLNILSKKIYKYSNIRAAQAEVEEFCKFIKERITLSASQNAALCDAVKNWLNYSIPKFHKTVQNCCKQYISLADGTKLFDGKQIPSSFDIEQPIADAIRELQSIQRKIVEEATLYEQWLRDHYYSYYQNVKKCSNSYIDFAQTNQSSYGELFYKNSGFVRFQINTFSVLLKKYKTLKANRGELIEGYDEVQQVEKVYPYISHEYIEIEKDIYLGKLVDNVKLLDSTADEWYKQNEASIEGFLERFSSTEIHKGYEHKKTELSAIETEFECIINRLKERGIIESDKIHYNSFNKLQTIITQVLKELELLSNDLSQLRADLLQLFELRKVTEEQINAFQLFLNEKNLITKDYQRTTSAAETDKVIGQIFEDIKSIEQSLHQFRSFFEWKQFFDVLPKNEVNLTTVMIEHKIDDWTGAFESWYYFWLLANYEGEFKDVPQCERMVNELFQLQEELKDTQIRSAIRKWSSRQFESYKQWQVLGLNPNSLYNKRGSRGERRNSLRKIVKHDFNFFTNFFPVLLVSPSVCSSVLPLEEGLFDVVIFDEASQLRLEDTFPALVRGKYKIISGDSQQMPPSSYFQGGGAMLNPEEDHEDMEELPLAEGPSKKTFSSTDLADSESLLVYAENSSYQQSFLKVHYRSQHPDLIEFSNHAFYGKRLIPMPAKSHYKAIEFVEVNGTYDEQVNKDEARRVVEILLNEIHPKADGKMPSVGVATFNLYQRNLILEEIIKTRQTNPEYDRKINDLGPDLFVKNLENIQGDERDIMILSTTFGRKPDGSFRQHFGPIIQKNGYKLLNVIITRAKYKVFVVSSIPIDHINQWSTLLQELRNNGRAVFYAYLAYSKAVYEGNIEVKQAILKQLYTNCESKIFELQHDSDGSESPFEEEVYFRLAEKIGQERIEQQYKIGGFRIDMVVTSKLTGKPLIAIECDGAKYHSSNEAYAWDMFRQKQLEAYGLRFHRIWSTNWWDMPEKELEKLVTFIYDHENKLENNSVPGEEAVSQMPALSSITTIAIEKKVVVEDSIITIKQEGKEPIKIRFSKPGTRSVKADSQGIILIPVRSVLAEQILGKKEGEVCEFGVETFYEILKVE
jgi:very-short-patch-repair endonuclease